MLRIVVSIGCGRTRIIIHEGSFGTRITELEPGGITPSFSSGMSICLYGFIGIGSVILYCSAFPVCFSIPGRYKHSLLSLSHALQGSVWLLLGSLPSANMNPVSRVAESTCSGPGLGFVTGLRAPGTGVGLNDR